MSASTSASSNAPLSPPEVLPPHMGRGGAVLPIPRVVEHQHARGVRCRQRVCREQGNAPRRQRVDVPGRFGEEAL